MAVDDLRRRLMKCCNIFLEGDATGLTGVKKGTQGSQMDSTTSLGGNHQLFRSRYVACVLDVVHELHPKVPALSGFDDLTIR